MRNIKKIRLAALVVSVVLLVGATVSGTLALMLGYTSPVTNTFTTSGIAITLEETTGDEYKMVPGLALDKDPVVTVKADSEDCWVFIEIKEEFEIKNAELTAQLEKEGKTLSFTDYVKYGIDTNNWTKLASVKDRNIYYTYSNDITSDRPIKVLGEGKYEGYEWGSQQVLTSPDVTEEMMQYILDDKVTKPVLVFTAYASQYWKNATENFTVEEAWENLDGVIPTP